MHAFLESKPWAHEGDKPQKEEKKPLQGLAGLTFKNLHPGSMHRSTCAYLQALPELYRKHGIEDLLDSTGKVFTLATGQTVQWEEISNRAPNF